MNEGMKLTLQNRKNDRKQIATATVKAQRREDEP